MIKIIKHIVVTTLLLVSPLLATPPQDHNLTDEQLHAFMGIVTNFILSDIDTIKPQKPTLTIQSPVETTDSNVTVEVNGEVGAKVFVNGIEVATIDGDGNVSIVLTLSEGSNSFSITLKDNVANESDALIFTINKVNNIISDLLINEVSSANYRNSIRWFEIYNPLTVPVDVSAYTLRSLYFNGVDGGIFEFDFPSRVIPPKGYLIVKSDHGPAYSVTLPDVENNEIVYLVDNASGKFPVWYSRQSSFLELLKDGNSVDFVTISGNNVPLTPDAWSGSFVPTFAIGSEYKSIARDIYSTDTNSSLDWTAKDFPTYAGLNDVTCNDDADQDGIPDCSEVNGSTYAGMDLYAFGARVNQKDIFIEVDYMDSTNGGALPLDEGIVPQQEALAKVQSAFASNGYAVHFDVGDLYAQNGTAINAAQMDLGEGNEIPYALSVSLTKSYTTVKLLAVKKENMKASRKQIFHYMLFGTSQNANGTSGSSGVAEIVGNDSLITLGGKNLSSHTSVGRNFLINYQAGTVMHEFGHNLGLRHGGDENKNFKPNYLSVMNYLYATSGLPTIGNNEGDRYYLEKYPDCPQIPLVNSAFEDYHNFKIDYSHGTGADLDELNGINEANGLGRVDSNPVDYNCDDNIGTVTNTNVNMRGDLTLNTLHDFDDWSAINIIFANTTQGSYGLSLTPNTIKPFIHNPIYNDVQPVAQEYEYKIPTSVY